MNQFVSSLYGRLLCVASLYAGNSSFNPLFPTWRPRSFPGSSRVIKGHSWWWGEGVNWRKTLSEAASLSCDPLPSSSPSCPSLLRSLRRFYNSPTLFNPCLFSWHCLESVYLILIVVSAVVQSTLPSLFLFTLWHFKALNARSHVLPHFFWFTMKRCSTTSALLTWCSTRASLSGLGRCLMTLPVRPLAVSPNQVWRWRFCPICKCEPTATRRNIPRRPRTWCTARSLALRNRTSASSSWPNMASGKGESVPLICFH